MNRNQNVYRMVMGALLCAVGIVIPMFSPVKIPLGPAGSFTLASHVAIFIAMFISPLTAAVVSLGTTLGFQLAGFPFPVVLRALSHIVWACIGAFWIKKHPDLLNRKLESIVFCVVIAVIHAVCEVLVILPLYVQGSIADKGGLFITVFVLVGGVTLLHSSVDFVISLLVWQPLRHLGGISSIASAK